MERTEQAISQWFLLAKVGEKIVDSFVQKWWDEIKPEWLRVTETETEAEVSLALGGLVSNLNQQAANVNWLQIQLANQRYLLPAINAVEQARRLVVQNIPIPQGQDIDFKSGEAWKAYGSNLLFLRNPDFIACTRQSVLGASTTDPTVWPCVVWTRPITENGGLLSYDWRLTTEVMLRIIADRLLVIAAIDPGFAGNPAFHPELVAMRNMISAHKAKIEGGIACGHRDEFIQGPQGKLGSPNNWLKRRYIACADVHTTQFHVRTQEQRFDGTFDEAATSTTKHQLRADLLARTPVSIMNNMIQDLAWYAQPPVSIVPLVHAQSNEALPGWPASHATDGAPWTAYSSYQFPTVENTRHTFIAAWTGTTQPVLVNQLLLTARVWNGVTQAFPARYHVWVTAPDNSRWDHVGVFTAQPNAAGVATVDLGLGYRTFGVYVMPEILGRDSYGGIFFQMADLALARKY